MRGLYLLMHIASRMSTAVMLLGVLAIASLAGTFLEQGLPVTAYADRFGSFWYTVFDMLGLFNVYAAPWFLAVGLVLAFSVACCLWRNGPAILAMAHPPKKVPLQSILKCWPLYRTYPLAQAEMVTDALQKAGYTLRGTHGDWLYYRIGAANRWGYFFTHIGVLVLCVAGLVSGLAGWRGTTNLTDGESYAATWLRQEGQMVSKPLPFTIRNDGFGMDFYNTGMPSNFYSDLTLLENGLIVKQGQIAVNHPMFYKGYAIYQASFGDAGSEITFRLRRLRDTADLSPPVRARVRENVRNDTTGEQVDIVDFRANTVESVFQDDTQTTPTFTDVGPSVDYILRVPDKSPLQLRSYMLHPHLVGLGDGQGNYTPMPLGLNPKEPEGWAMLAQLRKLYAEKTAKGDDVDALNLMKMAASGHLQQETAGERFAVAARVLQAAQVLAQTDLPAVLILDSFNQRLYTGLQVAHDPGADIFWVGGLLLVLGATLMSLFGFGRVWVGREGAHLIISGQSARIGVLMALGAALPQTEKEHVA
jgi:cytochrome c biogenesis protein